MNKKIGRKLLFGLFVTITSILILPSVMAAANFQVTSFSCTPSEVVINDVFSCTAQIKNTGDVAGSVNVATLYPDANDWLESSNYPQASGTSVDPGQSTEVTFTSLRAVKSGNNGFSKILLDDVTDTYVADNNIKENVINVVVTVSDSASSAAMGATVDSSAEVTAGGNIDVTLTFTVSSGGCSIGSQPSQKTISDMQDSNKQSRTWTITQGTSGDCQYSISAAATGTGGVASKTDSTSSTITCTDCSTDDDNGNGDGATAGGGGGGGGGGGAGQIYVLGELTSSQTKEIAQGDKIKFNISGVEYTLTLDSLTETTATLTVEDETVTLSISEGKLFDLNNNGISEISIKLKSINILTKQATLVLALSVKAMPQSEEKEKVEEEAAEKKGVKEKAIEIIEIVKSYWSWAILGMVVLIIGAYMVYRKIIYRKTKH